MMNCWIVPLFATFYLLFFLQLVYKCVMCSTVCVVVDESGELEIVQWKSRKFGPLWGTFVVAWPASPSQSPHPACAGDGMADWLGCRFVGPWSGTN